MDHMDQKKLQDHLAGCMICGRELSYLAGEALPANCYYCGKAGLTNIICPEGHYVCDQCHSKNILELVELECIKSDLRDPVALALKIFNLPQLHMHGPEYHSIVPAVLVAAYGNCVGQKDSRAIREAILRGKAIAGGMCGTHGACGSCVGVGIAYSIIHRATPLSQAERGGANRMTALALLAISETGGPRCCKREAITAIKTAKQHFGCFDQGDEAQYICRQFAKNKQCRKSDCPYYPGPAQNTDEH